MSDATTEAWFNRTMSEWYAANPWKPMRHDPAPTSVPTFRELCAWSDQANAAWAQRQVIDGWSPVLPRCLGMVVPMDRREEARLKAILADPWIGRNSPSTTW